ncbi:MAG TPA: hypothetical protein VKP58_13570 [Candidatus Acidoferrum sp.]|nr:hypothetical protein [Candidatus Acidoferrum sp.]
MIAIAHFAGLVLTTIFAAAAAVLLDWLFLRAMFQVMRPASVSHAQNVRLQKAGPTTANEQHEPVLAMAHRQKAGATAASTAKLTARDVPASTTFGAELVKGTRELVRNLGPAAVRR